MPDEPVDKGSQPKSDAGDVQPSPSQADQPSADGRHEDYFAPPAEPCECFCLHCQRTFSSAGIWFQRVLNAPKGELDGFWLCPTPNCDGKGFTFDIFPVDPNHPANDGWVDTDDDDEFDEDEFDDGEDADDDADDADDADINTEFVNPFATPDDADKEIDPKLQEAIEHDLKIMEASWRDAESLGTDDEESEADAWLDKPADEYDPAADAADVADIIEGDEWKLGYKPDEPVPESVFWQGTARSAESEAIEASHDAPDERPREIDWKELHDANEEAFDIDDDDIPF